MEIFKKYKNIIIVVVIVVVAAIAYTFFLDKTSDDLLTSEVKGTEELALESDLLTILINLRSIKLDDSIFSNPAFISLRDFGQDIVPEPVGRENPFAPVDINILNETVIEE